MVTYQVITDVFTHVFDMEICMQCVTFISCQADLYISWQQINKHTHLNRKFHVR